MNMRKITMLLSVILLAGCSKPGDTGNSCYSTGPVTNLLTGASGTVRYSSGIGKWTVQAAVAGTIDSVNVYILCSDPAASFQVDGKSVKVSGSVKRSTYKPSAALAGVGYLSLEWTSIE